MPDYDAGFKIVARAAGPALGELAYRDLPVMELIGREAMKESPFYDEIAADCVRDSVKQALELRFGAKATEEFRAALDGISDRERLSELHAVAVRCRRISDFRRALTADAAAR